MLDSNISLFLLASEFKDDPIELKASDKMIIDALKNFSSSSSEKEDITVLARETSVAASEIFDLVEQFEKTLDERQEKTFAENIRSRLNTVKIYLNQLATLKNQSLRTLKKWETEEVPLPLSGKKEEDNKTKKISVQSKKEKVSGSKKDLKKASPNIKTKTEGKKTPTKKKEVIKVAKTTSKTKTAKEKTISVKENERKAKCKSKTETKTVPSKKTVPQIKKRVIKEKDCIPKKNEKPNVKVVPKKNQKTKTISKKIK